MCSENAAFIRRYLGCCDVVVLNTKSGQWTYDDSHSLANTANLPNQTTITNSLQTSAIVYTFLFYN
jgi:hypothetical protein|eukprot:COSAG01_NODE_3145_length_6516_cov_55.678560_1_plen_66_part_00